ncbi:MAG TPA: flavin reductase family protein [Acidimicrobiales bacterium]|nr:flavin reductase family protein [Acidimicrobiales bacterium]
MADDLEESGAPTFDVAHLRQVMGHFATGVTIITAMDGRDPVGFTAQSFQSLSLDPPLVLFSPQKASTTWPKIKAAGTFCVNILSDDQEAVCRTFATSGADKFRGIGWVPGPRTGAPLLRDVLAWVEGEIVAEHDGGDHVIVVGKVLDLHVEHEGRPLLFYRGGFGRFEV